nr:MAG TPA: hypothetical protein [Bacteriophage sp.]
MKPFSSVFSLDFETTSTNPEERIKDVRDGVVKSRHKARIWSVGLATRSDGSEAIFNPPKEQLESEKIALNKRGFYAENQEWQTYVSGRKKPSSAELLFEATDRAILKHLDDSLTFGNSGMVLVQNLGFERAFYASLDGSASSRLMNQMYERSPDGQTKLYAPSEVVKARAAANDAKTLSELDAAMDKVIDAYKKVDASVMKYDAERAVKGGLPMFYAADLMDFTKATFVKAAAQGHIPEVYKEMGHNVDFLAKLFLGEEETHGALSDARQQIKLFDKITNLREELISGNISEESTGIFNKMKTASGVAREMQAAKSIISNIEKLKESGGWDSKQKIDTVKVPFINSLTGETGHIDVPRFSRDISNERGLTNFLSMAKERYGNTRAYAELENIIKPAQGNPEVAQDLLRNPDSTFRIGVENSNNSELLNKIIRGEKLTDDELVKIRNLNVSSGSERTLSEFAENTYRKIRNSHEVLRSILPENHRVGIPAIGLATAGGLLYMMGDSFDDDMRVKKLRDRQERLDFNQYNDPTFNKFSALDYSMAAPAGYMEAQYKESRRAYEY